jgi:DNA-binding PadR family transcriptional regulator
VQVVLLALVADPLQDRAGMDLAKDAGLSYASALPALARMERLGWLTSRFERWETEIRRPRRRRYRLSPSGWDAARAVRATVLPRTVGSTGRLGGDPS